jgi:hypothetical protein
MNRTRLLPALLLLASLGAAQSTGGGAAEIEQLQVKRDGADVTIQVILTTSVKPTVETAINPDRLVLILPGTLSDAKQKHFALDANGVRAVRLGLNTANPPVTRVVVDLDSAHPYTLDTQGNSITLRVQPSENAEVVVRRFTPAPAATAPLLGVFRRKPPTPPAEPVVAQAPIPVPPKLPPINFPEKQPAVTTASAANSTSPSATHPKLGSLQQGTVFPGMGTPGAGAVPVAQNATTIANVAPTTPAPAAQAAAPLAVKTTPASSAPASTTAPSSMTVSVASSATNSPSKDVQPGKDAQAGAQNHTTLNVTTASVAGPAPVPPSASVTSSAGSPNVTAKVLSATVATPVPQPAPSSTPAPTTVEATSPTVSTATVANSTASTPLPALASSAAPVSANTAATQPAAANALTAASAAASVSTSSSGATTTTQAAAATVNSPSTSAPAAPVVSTYQGATVANPLGDAKLVPVTPEGEAAPIEVVDGPDSNSVSASVTEVTEAPKEPEKKTVVVAKQFEPDLPAALALRAAHPDFRTAFRVKYVAAGAAYLDGGRSAGLSEGMKLVVRATPTKSNIAAADGNPDNLVAELEVTSVAESSAVTDIHTPTRDVKPGDLAYLSSEDEQALVQQSTLSATRKYPTVISFTEGDTLDEEARVQVPRPPMPSVNRARGRIGVDYMGTSFHGSTGGTSTDVGLVARLDMTRIGGTYWNASGYWRGRLTANNYTGNSTTIQDLLNRTYHLSMNYDNPNSPWVAGFGRMYLPYATSLDTLDGGYFGRRFGHISTVGVFAGSTPDPTSWSYSPDRRIGGMFVNLEGGSYEGLRFTSTTGAALSTLRWKIDRPFVFLENGIYYKRYVAIYDSLQADSPVGPQAGSSPGAGISRNFLTVRYQPHERIEFDANYTYLRDFPTFDTTLISSSLLDKYLFQGFSGGVRLEVIKNIWVYTNLGRSNRTGDTKNSLNQLYGLTFGRLPWIQVRADAHYARFTSSFGDGHYESVSLSHTIGDNFRLELLGGQQNFVSSLSSNSNSKFVTSNVEMNLGSHYFFQGGFTVSRGLTQSYDQWLFSLGYRFDSRRAKEQ